MTFAWMINLVKPGIFDINLNVDEDLGNYFESLEQDDKKQILAEEENLRRNYRVKTQMDSALERLRRAPTNPTGLIQGVHNYDIISNPEYAAAFQYVPADVPNRTLMI